MYAEWIKKLTHKGREKPLQPKNRISLPIEAPYRFLGSLLFLFFVVVISMCIVTVRDDLINKKFNKLLTDFFAYSSEHGWGINDVLINGRDKTDLRDLTEVINLNRHDNILSIDLDTLKAEIEKLPWVEKAQIKRSFFPNLITVTLEEKQVLALWQYGNRFYPVDTNGKLIEAEFAPHRPILVIVGRKAPEKINSLLELTSTHPELQKRIKAAILHSGRRWDIIFDDIENGITVKLPEQSTQQAWERFTKIDNLHGLLKRKLTFIDLRYKDKVIVGVNDSSASVMQQDKK